MVLQRVAAEVQRAQLTRRVRAQAVEQHLHKHGARVSDQDTIEYREGTYKSTIDAMKYQ